MANDLTLHVKTTADGRGLDQTADKLDKTTKATEKTKKATDKLGDSFHETTGELKDYNEHLRRLYAERAELSRSYQESGDRELLVEFNRTNRQIGMIEKLRKVVTDGATKVGPSAFGSLGSFGGMRGFGMPLAITGASALVAGALPLIGAMIGGAFSGTIVGAAMAGGIAAASKDESVRATARDFGDTISREFFASGDAFVTPIRNSLNILEGDFQDLELESAFAKVAPQVEDVAHGIGDLAKNFMPGFNRVLDRSAGFTEEFTDGLGDLGSALGKMVDDMSSSEGAVEGLNALFKVVNGTLVFLGMTVNVLADTFDKFTDIGASVTGFLEDIPEPLQIAFFGHAGFGAANDIFEDLNQSGFKAADGIGRAGGAANDAARDARELAEGLKAANDAFKTYLGIQADVDDSIIAQKQGMLEFAAALKENGKHWEDNNEKGLANQEQLREQVRLAGQVRDAQVAAADGNKAAIEKANAEYDKTIAKLRQMATDAGITEAKFKDLAGTYTVRFFLQQEVGKQVVSWSELRNAERKLSENNSGPGVNRQFVEYRADGGPVQAGVPYMINERGMETVTFPASGTVHPANLTPMATANAVTLTVMPGGSDPFVRAMVELISRYVRVDGGGSGAALGITS